MDAVRARAYGLEDRAADEALRRGNTPSALARSGRYQRMIDKAVSNMLVANKNRGGRIAQGLSNG